MGNQHGGKLKKRDLMGYGAATIADSDPYNFVTVYLILLFTVFHGSDMMQTVIYVVAGLMFWTGSGCIIRRIRRLRCVGTEGIRI